MPGIDLSRVNSVLNYSDGGAPALSRSSSQVSGAGGLSTLSFISSKMAELQSSAVGAQVVAYVTVPAVGFLASCIVLGVAKPPFVLRASESNGKKQEIHPTKLLCISLFVAVGIAAATSSSVKSAVVSSWNATFKA